MAIKIGHDNEGREVRVATEADGGATIGFIREGRVEILALTGNAKETARVLAKVTFDDENDQD